MNQPPAFIAPANRDAEHLKLLAIFHFIFAVLCVLGIGFIFMHYMIMSTVFENPKIWEEAQKKNHGEMPFNPQQFFGMFKIMYIVFGVTFAVAAVCNLLSGLFLRARKNRMFTFVVAGLDCLQIPFGTALGVFTIIVLSRDSVRGLYMESAAETVSTS